MIGPSSFTPLPPNLPLTPTAFTYSYMIQTRIHLFNASARSKNHTEPLGTRLSLISISPRGARHINYTIINIIIIIIIMDRPTSCYLPRYLFSPYENGMGVRGGGGCNVIAFVTIIVVISSDNRPYRDVGLE